jgi:hypothetical protein
LSLTLSVWATGKIERSENLSQGEGSFLPAWK